MYGASKNVGSACSGDGSNGKAEIEEADSSSRGKKGTTSLPLFMEAFGLEVEEELGQKGYRLVNGQLNKKNQAPVVQTWRHMRGPASAVMCETRDLGIK